MQPFFDPGASKGRTPRRGGFLSHFVAEGCMLRDLVQDLRHALRSLRREPGMSSIILASLVLGIGLNTAMFSVVNTVLLRPLPYPESERLVSVFEFNQSRPRMSVTVPNFSDLLTRTRTLESLGAWRTAPLQVAGAGQSLVATVAIVTSGFFPALQVSPHLGRRPLTEEEEIGGTPVALLGYRLWQRAFGGDSSLVGTTLRIDNQVVTVIGIMPPAFQYPSEAEIWVPEQFSPLIGTSRTSHNLFAIARFRPEVSLDDVRAELRAIGAGLEAEYDELGNGFRFGAVPLADDLTRTGRASLVLLQIIVTLILIIGCGNLAFVLLARAVARSREMAIRQAIGGATSRLARQVLTESAFLGLAGGLGGAFVAVLALGPLNRLVPAGVLHSGPVTMDWRVMVYGLVVGLGAGAAFGLAPVIRTIGLDLNRLLRGGSGHGAERPGGLPGGRLLVVQYGLSCATVITAVVMAQSLIRLQDVEEGFRVANRVAAQLLVPVRDGTRYTDSRSALALLDRLEARILEAPGMHSVTFDRTPPLTRLETNQRILPEQGNDLGQSWPENRTVSRGYFAAMGIPMIRGREFTRSDSLGAPPVAIVNARLAREVWGERDPVGQRFRRWPTDPWITVVGVAGDVCTRLDREPNLAIYLPLYQSLFGARAMTVIVEGTGATSRVVASLRDAVHTEDSELALRDVRTLEALRHQALALPRLRSRLIGLLGMLAVLLVVLGTYGVLTHAVGLRRRELAIRAALGARPRGLISLILRQGGWLVIWGSAVGSVSALLLSRLLRALVFEVDVLNPAVVGMTLAGMAGVTLLACLIPARRAARIDPARMLRSDSV